jgi:hypothetical protein
MTRFSVGEHVYKLGVLLANEAVVVGVVPKKWCSSQKYLIKEWGSSDALIEIVAEARLVEHD